MIPVPFRHARRALVVLLWVAATYFTALGALALSWHYCGLDTLRLHG